MTVTADSLFKSAARITRQDFKTILERDAAPGLAAERDCGEYFDAIRSSGVDPLFLLAMFNHESTLGKFGMARQTHSWGNTRPPSFGVPQVAVINNFSVYANWLDGCKSTAGRLADSNWVYSGTSENDQTGQTYGPRTAIRELFDHPSGQVWAPAGDSNDPAGYLRAVLDYMNAHASSDATGGAVSVPKPAMVSVSGVTNFGGYAATRRIDALVLHVTDDDNLDGTLSWFKNPASKASANVVIDFDGTIYECVPKNQSAWTNGVVDAPDPSNPLIANWLREGVSFSQRTYTVERVGKRNTHPTDAQLQSMVTVAAWVCDAEHIPIDRTHILGHNQIDSVNRSYCPSLTEAEFTRIIDGARALAVGGVIIPPDAPTPDCVVVNGVPICHGFKAFWERLGDVRLLVLGYPKAPEFAPVPLGGVGSAQEFERNWLVWEPANSAPWDIHCATLDQVKALEAFRHG